MRFCTGDEPPAFGLEGARLVPEPRLARARYTDDVGDSICVDDRPQSFELGIAAHHCKRRIDGTIKGSVDLIDLADEEGAYRSTLALHEEGLQWGVLETGGACCDQSFTGDDLSGRGPCHEPGREVGRIAHHDERATLRVTHVADEDDTQVGADAQRQGCLVGDSSQDAEQSLTVVFGCRGRARDQGPSHRVRFSLGLQPAHVEFGSRLVDDVGDLRKTIVKRGNAVGLQHVVGAVEADERHGDLFQLAGAVVNVDQ